MIFFFVLATKQSTETDLLCKLHICTKRRLNVVITNSVNKGFAIAQKEKSSEEMTHDIAHTLCAGHKGMQNSKQPTTYSSMPCSLAFGEEKLSFRKEKITLLI